MAMGRLNSPHEYPCSLVASMTLNQGYESWSVGVSDSKPAVDSPVGFFHFGGVGPIFHAALLKDRHLNHVIQV